MPTEMLSERESVTPPPSVATHEPDSELRQWARSHVERVRKLK